MNKYNIGDRVVDHEGTKGTVHYRYSTGMVYNVHMDDESVFFAAEHDLEPAQENTVTNPLISQTGTPTTTDQFNLAATKALVKVARAKKTFTTDDLWATLPAGSTAGLDPRVIGAFMVEAAKGGYIKATGRYKPSKRSECHKRPVRVWKSLIFASK